MHCSSPVLLEQSTTHVCDTNAFCTVAVEEVSDDLLLCQYTQSNRESLILSDADRSSNSESDDDSDDMSMSLLLSQLSKCDQDLLFQQNGLEQIKKIRITIQGELLEGVTSNMTRVQIKKIDKACYENKTSLETEDDMHYVVDDDIIKEQTILKYLTHDSQGMSDAISKPIAFFESESDYYLVTETPTMTLKQFCTTAQEYIKQGRLTRSVYNKWIKQIFFQLSVVVYWLHCEKKCCHLSLSMDNITLENTEFFQDSNGSMTVTPEMKVKLTDFSQAEMFENGVFKCDKFPYLHHTEDSRGYLSPNRIDEKVFDARSADLWSLGMILFEMVLNEPLYTTDVIQNGYWAVMSGNITQYLGLKGLVSKLNRKMLSVINQLLQVNEEKRINSKQLLQCKWLSKLSKNISKEI